MIYAAFLFIRSFFPAVSFLPSTIALDLTTPLRLCSNVQICQQRCINNPVLSASWTRTFNRKSCSSIFYADQYQYFNQPADDKMGVISPGLSWPASSFHIIIINMMNPTVYLRTGDLITISHEGLFLAIESLTQSVPTMKESISNSSNAVFLLTTQKCLQRSLDEQKPLLSYNEDDIYYSEPILLYHLLSGKFLSYNKDIENKASVELVSSFKQNCKFSIKPIFKCQTVITRKIRNQESVVICPAEAYNHEGNIALVVLRNDSRKGDQSYILMKKNQNSKFQLERKNEPSLQQTSLSNIHIYQLINIETKKNLYMTQNQLKHKDLITFEKSINEFGSYFDIRLKETEFDSIGVTEKQIKYGMAFYIHSWKENKYLSINVIGDACLTQIPNQEAEFVIQSYSDLQLTRDSVVRIRHVSSNKFLSMNQQASEVQVTHEMKLIDTFMIVKVPIEELRLNVFINDTHEIIQRELSGKKISYNNRENIFRVLKELINFIYGDEITISDFLSMKNKTSCKLSSNDQKLLANIGIINTLVRMCRTFIEEITREPEIKEYEQRDNTDEQIIIIYTMMSIVGICNRNAASTRILVQEMPLLYESLVSVSGIIESFYNLFKDSKQLLLILENTSHKIGRKDVPSMEVLINMLAGHTLDIPTKCKILKLLQVFVIVNHKEKILSHEAILLKSLIEGKLENVMIPMISNDSEDLFINVAQKTQKKPWEELEQLLNSRKTYEKELQLVKTQLELLCSLCVNSNTQCFNYANKIITEEMLFRYLKSNLQPDFKQIFMRILIDVYLSNLAYRNNSMSKSFIICNKNKERGRNFSRIQESSMREQLITEDGQEMTDISSREPSHSKIIENIQNYILEITKKSITNEIIDSSFYMNLKSLRKFLDLRILDKDEVVEFRLLLIQYIAKFSKQSFKEEEKKKIVLQIIKIMTDYFNQYLEAISQEFVFMLRDEKISNHKLFERFTLFTEKFQFFDSQIQKEQLKYLPKLIRESIQFNCVEVFIAASNLFKIVNERHSVFLYRLREKIIIDSDWISNFYSRAEKTKKNLNSQIQAYMSSKSDQKQIQYIEQQLNQLVKQLNFCYFQNANSNSSQFSQLTQNMYREMNLLEMIINFLNESQDKFKEGVKGNIDIYSTCFEFSGLYLQDSRENFSRFQDKYLDIKFVFEHPDRGQIKFLNQLIKMPNARDLMIDEIIGCIILSFEHNIDPNPYTLLALINAISNPHIDKQRIEVLVEKLIREPMTFQNILKVKENKNAYFFSWSYDPESKSYHKDWLIYAFLMIKFLIILLEQSSERTTLALQIQKYISIQSLMELLKAQDLLVNTSMSCLEASLLKTELIKLFIKIYLPLLEKEQNQMENISSFVHLTLQSLSYVKEDHEGANVQLLEEVIQKTSDHGAIIFQAEIKVKTKITLKEFQKYFNPIYTSLVQRFPFIVKMLDKLLTSNSYVESNLSKKSELSLFMENIYRKMRDFVQFKLPYKQFSAYSKQYNSAISNCEDLFKKKLGFNLDIEENEEDEDAGQIEVNDYYINTKIENTIKCYKFATNENEKKIYEALIFMFHDSEFRELLRKEQQNFPIVLTFEQMERIKQMMLKFVTSNPEKFSEITRLFYFFCQFNKNFYLKMSFTGVREEIMRFLVNEKEDPGNLKLCSYMAVTTRLFREQIEKQTNVIKKNEAYFAFKDDFIARIRRRLDSEKQLYISNKISEQAVIYSQNGLLNYESIDSQYSIDLCLQWIRNMTIITPFKLREKMYSALFMEVVDLLKVYTVFLKQFNCKYINFEIYRKINFCLQIIFHFISGLTSKSILINYLIERQIWNDLNLILGLDDGWSRNLDELEDSQIQTFAKVARNQLRTSSRIFLKQAEKLYENSKKNYKQIIPTKNYPLLPMKSLFGQAKSNVISILKQFKHFPFEIEKQLLSRIDIPIINRNIFEVYRKHHRLFNEYDIPSVETDINFGHNSEWKEVAQNLVFENGVDLTSLKMHINTISGNYELKTEYNNLKLQALTSKKIQSAFSSFFTFIKDFFLLFISCFLSLCRKKKNTYKKEEQEIDEKKMLHILNFFLTKVGRVEVTFNKSQLLCTDYFIRPECHVSKDTKQKFIQRINFVSMQLKLESIYNQAGVFRLYFQNEIDFYRQFNKFTYLTFLTRNVEMLIYLNFAVIVAENFVLILHSGSMDQYFTTNSLDQPFVWIQIASTIIAASVMVAYCVKDLPLLIKNINMTLKIRAESYGSNYNNYNALVKVSIKLSMVLLNPTFAYHLVYTFIVCLVFYNKLFAALLMLDIFFQIPTLKNLLMSVWRPKVQLILALVSFVLLQYFFSIFMFFNFKKQTFGFCSTLGSCFGFVFVTTYKAVGGFVGYLFIKNGSQIPPVNFFEIFQDVYVVLIFQIFFALILAIIIDTFSLIRNEQTIRKEYLNGCCIVCNLDKTRFNSSTMSFKAHIAITHNIWSYFYYYEYINHKPALRRTSYEREIFLTRSAIWLPMDASFDVNEERVTGELEQGVKTKN